MEVPEEDMEVQYSKKLSTCHNFKLINLFSLYFLLFKIKLKIRRVTIFFINKTSYSIIEKIISSMNSFFPF